MRTSMYTHADTHSLAHVMHTHLAPVISAHVIITFKDNILYITCSNTS